MLVLMAISFPIFAHDKTGEQCSWTEKDDKGQVTKKHEGNLERTYNSSGALKSYECYDGTDRKSAGYKLGWD